MLVTRLNEGLREAGVNVDRLDRHMPPSSPLYRRGGVKSGGRYTLTTQGIQHAERLLRGMLE